MSDEPAPSAEWRTLRRSRTDRYVAGVVGGLARRLDVDPLVLRITMVALGIFGIGVLLYALGWLLIPAEDEDASVVEQALGRGTDGRSRTDAVALTLGLGLLVLISAGGILSGWGEGAILLVLAVCGVALLLRRDDRRTAGGAAGWQPVTADADPDRADAGEPAGPASGWVDGPDWDPDRPWADSGQQWDQFAEPEPAVEPTRSRSSLGLLTVSAAAVTIGAIAVNDAIWATVPPATYIASALAIVGVGLLVGAWLGRSRGLIVLGVVLSFALVPAGLFNRFDFRGEKVEISPATVAEIPVGTQDHGVGEVRYDLSAVEFTDTDSVSLGIDQGAGELIVIVPPEVDVTLEADLGVGELQAFDDVSGGLGREARIVDEGADGDGGGELELRLDLGLGRMEVHRAAA